MTTRKTTRPRTARRAPRRPPATAAEKRQRLIEKLLSVDELGNVAGGNLRCDPKCGCEPGV